MNKVKHLYRLTYLISPATCSAHLIVDFMTVIILGDKQNCDAPSYVLFSRLLLLSLSLLGPDILLNIPFSNDRFTQGE
jgi:hypothetical protein